MKINPLLALLLTMTLFLSMLPPVAVAQSHLCAQDGCHKELQYVEGKKATCTRQGSREYWYCAECGSYYENGNFADPVAPDHQEGWITPMHFLLPAQGHAYDEAGVCVHCGMNRPVYSPVTNLAQFDSLRADSSFLLVIRDGEKTYSAFVPNFENPCDADSDGDGIVDALETDENGDGIPDCVEMLFADWCNCDMDGDGDIDAEDYQLFVADFTGSDAMDMQNYKQFLECNYYDIFMLYEAKAYALPNFVEVTLAADGTITLAEEGAMEFQLMPGGVLGGKPGSQEEQNQPLNTERICAAWVPNYWIGSNGKLGLDGEGHFSKQYRVYGDEEYPGIADQRNWKISFRENGSVCFVGGGQDYDDSAALQFVKYIDGEGQAAMTIVGLSQALWEESPVMENTTDSLDIYLYAAQPVYGEIHNWDAGTVIQEPTCETAGIRIYHCGHCDQSYTEEIPALGHTYVDGICVHCGQVRILLGDVNGDGKVNARDARLLLRYIAGLTETGEILEAAADFNGDGRINARDARAMLQYIADGN